MSKKSVIIRQEKRLILVEKYKQIRKNIKEKMRSIENLEEKISNHNQIQKLPRNSSKSRLRNRCIITGRGRGYYRMFGLSRHVLRNMSHYGLLPGVKKSSW
uniref:Small ribosomal subunit protein uS14c n=1 Tax=Euglena mutabilis TaxID=38275 RepID=A0A1B0UL04_EUGMU|nr:ribosomal protein S14 [Euglena mutabilis]